MPKSKYTGWGYFLSIIFVINIFGSFEWNFGCLSFKRKLVACNEFPFLQNNIYCLTKNLRSHGFLHDMLLQNTQNWKYKYIINIEKSYFKSSKFISRYNEIIWINRIIIISMLNDVLFFYYSSIIWYAWNEQLCQTISYVNKWMRKFRIMLIR